MTKHLSLKHLFAALLTLVALFAGQQAFADTKTVIYRIGSSTYSESNHSYTLNFVIADGSDTPFDGGQDAYQVTINESSLNNLGGGNGAGDYTVNFSDGFSLRLQWEAGSNVNIIDQGGVNISALSDSQHVTYTVIGGNSRYFTTHLDMQNNEGSQWMTTIDNHVINPDFDYAYQLQESYNSRDQFGRIKITYTDEVPITLLTSPSANTYNITSKRDLAVLASYVNVGHNDCENLTFLQTQDIDCDDTYTPIGYYNNLNDNIKFRGTYDGQSHFIRNITVNRTGNTDADNCVGLFGYIKRGTVQNVVLANSTFTGYNYVGGIVGYCDGNISGGCSTVRNCRVDNNVTINAGHDGAMNHGGIVGFNHAFNAQVIGCLCGATVSHNGKSECVNFGGIVGKNDGGTIENCLYTGSSVTGDDKIGAIVGDNKNSHLTNNYYNNDAPGGVNGSDMDAARRARTVTLGENVGIVGTTTVYNVSGIIAIGTGNYAMRRGNNPIFSGATQTLTIEYTGTISDGYAFNGFIVKDSDNNDVNVSETSGIYTFIMPDKDVTVTANIEVVPWSGNGSAESPYLIGTIQQLNMLASKVNEGNDYTGKYFLQTAHLVYDGTENNYIPIGRYPDKPFNGIYDGGGHIISGIWVKYTSFNTDSDYVGLFGHLGYEINTDIATVQNVVLANCTFAGHNNVGGIAGSNNGNIRNCRVESSVNIYPGTNYGQRHGGIAGGNQGSVIGCVSAAVVSNNSAGSTACQLYGGIAGTNYPNNNHFGAVRDCLYTGTTVIAEAHIGAILGANSSHAFYTNNYYNTTVAIVPGGVNGSDTDGACRARTITLGEGVVIRGEETIYNVSGITAIGSVDYAIKYNNGTTTTIYSGVGHTITLDAQEGYKLTSATLSYGGNDYNIEPDNGVYSFVMPNANVTVSATVEPGALAVNYELFSGDLVEGDYLIVYDGFAINNIVMNNALQYKRVNAINNVITTGQTDIVWHIAPSGDRWTIYSAEANKYLASNNFL